MNQQFAPLKIVSGTTNISPAAKLMLEDINKKMGQVGGAMVINGAFGDMSECDGIVEEVIQKPEGGIFLKLYGNPHLFKGMPRFEVVEMLNLPKSVVSLIPRELLRSWYLRIMLAGFYIFSRKHFWHALRTIFQRVHDLSLTRIRYPNLKSYSRPIRHLRQCFENTIRQIYNVDINSNMVLLEGTDYIGPREKLIFAACVSELVYQLIENDNAYRLRLQDIFREFNRENIEKDVRGEILRLLDIAIKREKTNLMIEKWIFLRRLASFILRFKAIKKFAKHYFLMIEKEEMVPDGEDWYFSLRRSGYEFNGMPIEERLKIKEQIDKEKGHIPMQRVDLKLPDGRIEMGIKLV